MSYTSTHELQQEQVIRRRFYLSKGSLAFLDELAMLNGTTSSILLDDILREMRLKREDS